MVVLSLLVAPACGDDEPERGATVFAAASLTEVFTELAETLDFPVTYNFGGSGALVTQIEQGAPADVIATADLALLERLRDGRLIEPPVTFATNQLEILVAPGNPKKIAGLTDLARDDVTVVLADDSVPAGKYATQILNAAAVTVRPKSLELDVKAAVAKVTAGEADATIAYVSDVRAAGSRASAVAIPERFDVSASYGVAIVRDTKHRAAARRFLAALVSRASRELLRDYGFSEAP